MRHLTPEQLLDLAEGAKPESMEPHLASCDACRRQLADTREITRAAADVEVPEPSPLFWDHLSAHVRDAVANEPCRRPRALWTWTRLPAWRAGVAVMALVAMILAVAITLRVGKSSSTSVPAGADTPGDMPAVVLLQDDPSLNLMADLASDLEWDAVAEAGLIPPSDLAVRAVDDLSADERVELERLLKEELSRLGA